MMSNYDPRNPNSRPNTPPPSIAWFEFLLDEKLLEKHLQKPNPDPSPGALIAIFLHQAEVAANIASEIIPPPTAVGEEPAVEVSTSKRTQALRLLALKTAAYLKWNLKTLENSVPVPMVYKILQNLLQVTLKPEDLTVSHVDLDIASLPTHALFALQIYHRWCLRTVVKDSFPSKPTKVPTVQIPGLMDANIAAGAKEPIVNIARNTVADSLVVLERLLQQQREISMPTLECFGFLTETTDTAVHEWHRGKPIATTDLRCQVCYDLGCLYFMKEDYANARNMLAETRRALKQVTSDFVDIDQDQLNGYSVACHMVDNQSLYSKVQKAKRDSPQELPALLQKDNQKQEIGLQYRVALEEELQTKVTDKSQLVLYQVQCCNSICRLQHGQNIPPQFLARLEKSTPEELSYIAQVIREACSSGSFTQKANVKKFIWFLCLRFPEHAGLRAACTPVLTAAEAEALQVQQQQMSTLQLKPPDKPAKDGSVEQLEQQLRSSYNPDEIQSLAKKLLSKSRNVTQVLHLTEKWRLPKELFMIIEKQVRGFDMLFINIMVGNAKTSIQLQQYETARVQLRAADMHIKDKSYNLSRLLRYELLHVDLLEFEVTRCFPPGLSREDLIKKVKTCITSMQHEQGLHPPLELVASCAAFLLSMGEWEYTLSLNNPSRFLQFAKIISAVTKELPSMKNARKPARALWDALILIFTSAQKQQRKGASLTTTVQRDGQMGILSQTDLNNFVKKILEPLTISVLISCTTKLYNSLKDDIISEISSDYLILWPTALGSSGSLNTEGVSEAMTVVMEQALKYNPGNPSWLRTQADIHIAHNQYSQALKYYLQSGMVTTDGFSDPVPESVYSDEVYKRMIKCCSYLQCHTQVAVLCQFLKDPDYMTAFKALQERNSYDATDVYHDCIWDVTMLEYIINLHAKRGEHEKKQDVIKLIGQPELNCSNPAEIQSEAAKYRMIRFLRAMSKQFA